MGVGFHKRKLCIDRNWFIAKIILVSLKYLFCGYSKWQQINTLFQTQTVICHQIFGESVTWNHMKFTKEYDMYAEASFSKKTMFENGLNMSLSLPAWTEKTVNGKEILTLWFLKNIQCNGRLRSSYWQSYQIWKDPFLFISLKDGQL